MLFQGMEDFTLFDGLVPSSGLLDISPAVEEQLESGILFPGDSLVKNDVSPGDLFEDFLSDNTLEGKFLYIFKGRQVFFLFIYFFLSLSRDVANQRFATFPVKVRKYFINILLCKKYCITLVSFDKCKHFCK